MKTKTKKINDYQRGKKTNDYQRGFNDSEDYWTQIIAQEIFDALKERCRSAGIPYSFILDEEKAYFSKQHIDSEGKNK